MTDEFAGRVAERCGCDTYGFKLDRCDSLQQRPHNMLHLALVQWLRYMDREKGLLA